LSRSPQTTDAILYISFCDVSLLAATGVFISACDALRPKAGEISRTELTLRTLALSLRDSRLMAPPLSNCSPTESSRSATEAADLELAAACDCTKCSVRRFLERPGLERGARVLLSNHDNLPVNRGKSV